MNTIPIYTMANWHLVRYLWPNGTLLDNRYSVFLNSDSDEYTDKLAKLRTVNSSLADAIAVWSDTNAAIFIIRCSMDYARPVWPYRLS